MLITNRGFGTVPYVFRPPIIPGDLTTPTGVRYWDEREWALVFETPAFADAWRNVTAALWAYGFEIKPKTNSRADQLDGDLAREIIGAIADPMTLYGGILSAGAIGWSAVNVSARQYRRRGPGPFRYALLPHVATRVEPQMLPLLRYQSKAPNPGPENSMLEWNGPAGRQLWTPEEASWEWIIGKVGNNASHPYGDPFICRVCWLLARALSRFVGGVTESPNFGSTTIKAKVTGGGTPEAQGKITEQARRDLAEMIAAYRTMGVLIETDGAALEVSQNGAGAVDGAKEFYQLIAGALRTLISGQELTAQSSGTGPAGSSKVQASTRLDYARYLADAVLEPAMNRWLVAWLNLNGREVDPVDAPKFIWGGKSFVPEATIRVLIEFGAELYAERVARSLGGDPAVDLLVNPDAILGGKPAPAPTPEPSADQADSEEEPQEDLDEPEEEEPMERAAGSRDPFEAAAADENALARAMDRALGELDGVPDGLIGRALESGRASEITESGWFKKWTDRAVGALRRGLSKLWKRGAKSGAAEIEGYDPDFDKLVRAKVEDHIRQLWPDVDAATRSGIASALSRGQAVEGAKAAAAAIRPMLGLTTAQIDRIAEWEREQMARGASEDDIRRGVEQRTASARNQRARGMAGEGTSTAINYGRLAAAQDAVQAGRIPATVRKSWIVRDANARPLHRQQAALPAIPLGELFPIFRVMAPPGDHGCRCLLGFVFD